jgi:hypothetical protein
VMTSWQLRPYTYIYIYRLVNSRAMPRGGFLYTAPCPLENTTPAVKTSFEATSKPGRAHFESTWLEKARKRRENRPRSCFGGRLGHSKTPHLPSNRASRPLRSQCHQIWPQGHFEATSSPLRDHLARTHSKTPRKPASKPLSKSLGPLENTAPAIKSGLEATLEPLRAHFETTWLENTLKHRPRSHFRSHLDRSKTPHLPSNPASLVGNVCSLGNARSLEYACSLE